MKRRIGILTGGGDVPPLNAVIHSAFHQGTESGIELIGIVGGWQGLIARETVQLGSLDFDPSIGGTVLRSSRVNLAKIEDAYQRLTTSLTDLRLDGLIVVGGEDTLSNAFHLKNIPQVLISKTIDNDVGINAPGRLVNYFTLGYPTAAEKISSFVSLKEGLRTTAYSHERIMIVESMGMHAGWLAMSSAMGHPDFIIIPEFPLDYESLKEKLVERYRRNHNAIIVISEGAKWSNGKYVSADENDRDNFGHPKFKGAADVLARKLKSDLQPYFDTRNVNSVNPSYLYRSGKPNPLDLDSASTLGKEAVKLIARGISEPVFLTLKHEEESFVTEEYYLKNLENIENFHRFVDRRYYDAGEFQVSIEAVNYLSNIINDFEAKDYGFVPNNMENR